MSRLPWRSLKAQFHPRFQAELASSIHGYRCWKCGCTAPEITWPSGMLYIYQTKNGVFLACRFWNCPMLIFQPCQNLRGLVVPWSIFPFDKDARYLYSKCKLGWHSFIPLIQIFTTSTRHDMYSGSNHTDSFRILIIKISQLSFYLTLDTLWSRLPRGCFP